jgi:hypothetical protein
MTSGNEKTRRPRPRPKTKPSLDVMVARGTGRVRTFKVSPRILLVALVFFMLYIPISVWVINDYLLMREQRKTEQEEISRLHTELDDARNKAFRYQQRVALLREQMQTDKTEPLKSAKDTPLSEGTPPMAAQETTGSQARLENTHRTILPPAADIKDLAVYREGENLRVVFKVVNLKDAGTLQGYAFVVALDPANPSHGLWSYPQAVLQEGIPVDHRNGFRFVIRNFKTITMTHGLGPGDDLPPVLRFLVYDTAGNLLRQEEVEVKPEG